MTDIEPTRANDTPAVPLAIDATRPEPESQSISDRVKAAQARIAERTAPARAKAGEQAKAAANNATQFVKDHPALAITGAIVAGAAIAFALPGRPGRKLRGGAIALGGLAAELAATYGSRMLTMAEEAAQSSQEKLGEIGESFASAGESLAGSAAETGATVLESVKRASEATASQAQSLAGKLKR
ncbi:hypothetical protein [Croceicoccus bisphenolivorans]|uniref:hypothetical protein n=1 Tax=Croceicoccus bisphenolivorans TaxID=1783232 RepID=UPI000836A3F1|nr:hypothetical protein [Croceicoccus bisphenolivorans]